VEPTALADCCLLADNQGMNTHHTHLCFWVFVSAGNLPLVCAAARGNVPQTLPAAYKVTDFGAKADAQTKDTPAIQKALDTCSESGGGTVYFAPGTYLSGGLHLRSRVALYLDHGAVLRASTEENDFDPYEELGFKNAADRETSFFHHSLIWAEDAEQVAILGTGTIDGNRDKRGGPKPIALKRCQHVTIKDITIRNAPNYAISLLGTDYVNINGVSIFNGYCDGIDPDACRYVRIANCQIDTWDDAIVPKASFSLGVRRAVEYLTVTNCILATNCSGFKLGTESGGGFRHITVSNCVMHSRATGRPPISGIALESVDGGDIDGVTISNISMANVRAPIFLRLGNRGRDMDQPVPGALRNVLISNIVATGASQPCPIVGIPEHSIRNVILDNIQITRAGGGTTEQTNVQVPEYESKYPEATMFGTLPSYGLYCRHVEGLTVRDLHLTLQSPDYRPALLCDDVSRVVIDSLDAPQFQGAEAVIRFQRVKKALLCNCLPTEEISDFLKVTDGGMDEVTWVGNDVRRTDRKGMTK
jgi:polygalacturonase